MGLRKLDHLTEPELKVLMNQICKSIEDTAANLEVERPHFCVLVFNDPKSTQYASNCMRTDMIKALHEVIRRLMGKQDVKRN